MGLNNRSRRQSPPASGESQCELWAERSRYWSRSVDPAPCQRTPRKRSAQPIVLCGHGVSLNVDRGTLLIRDGLSHYPQVRVEHRIFPGDPTRPRCVLVVDGTGSITFDVIDWLREQDITLIRIDWRGTATVIAGATNYAADGAAWRRQETLRSDPKRRMVIARNLIRQKLENSVVTLESCIPSSKARDTAFEVIGEKLSVLASRAALNPSGLHGIEGRAAKVYFDAWVGTPLSWRTSKRHPIPEAWGAIGQRQSMNTGKKGKNRDASHPVNAMLNYAYAVLESHVRLDALASGYDPRAGFLHSGYRDSPALVLDLMEPMRPRVDAAVLKFVRDQCFSGADFVLRSDGVCRLNPQLARRVARMASEAAGKSPIVVIRG